MRLNQETDYALRLVYIFTCKKSDEYLSAKEIAFQHAIPFRFLLKVMIKLKKAGIIASRQGIDGGYKLAKKPRDINLKDVIEAIEGPININRCLKSSALCNAGLAPLCKVHRTLAQVQSNLLRDLESHNFESIEGWLPFT